MIAKLVSWIILGAVVGWIVSLFMGRDFKGGCLTYVLVGIATMVILGYLLKFFWLLVVLSVIIVAISWLVDVAGRR